MEKFDIYKDIAERTGGDIYIGVVGPVRTGKSTFIKRFMDLLVLPNIANPPQQRQRNRGRFRLYLRLYRGIRPRNYRADLL